MFRNRTLSTLLRLRKLPRGWREWKSPPVASGETDRRSPAWERPPRIYRSPAPTHGLCAKPASRETSWIMASTRQWRIYLRCASEPPLSSTAIWKPSRTSWRPSWIGANSGVSAGLRKPRRGGESPDSSSITLANWPSCKPWCASRLAAGGTLTTRELHPQVAQALGLAPAQYRLTSLRYEISKLRAKGLVEKVPHSHRYRLLAEGYRLCIVYLKLFEKSTHP